jgi:hypothetical protein
LTEDFALSINADCEVFRLDFSRKLSANNSFFLDAFSFAINEKLLR